MRSRKFDLTNNFLSSVSSMKYLKLVDTSSNANGVHTSQQCFVYPVTPFFFGPKAINRKVFISFFEQDA